MLWDAVMAAGIIVLVLAFLIRSIVMRIDRETGCND